MLLCYRMGDGRKQKQLILSYSIPDTTEMIGTMECTHLEYTTMVQLHSTKATQ